METAVEETGEVAKSVERLKQNGASSDAPGSWETLAQRGRNALETSSSYIAANKRWHVKYKNSADDK